MIFLLEATLGFPVNLKQTSDWDVVNVKQQHHLINILKLSWSSSFTSIKTVQYFQWLFIALGLKWWDKKSQQGSRGPTSSLPLLLKDEAAWHSQRHDSPGNNKSCANIHWNSPQLAKLKIITSPLKEHKHIYLRSCNKLVKTQGRRPECLSFNHHIPASLYWHENQTTGPVTQTSVPAPILLQSFLPEKEWWCGGRQRLV